MRAPQSYQTRFFASRRNGVGAHGRACLAIVALALSAVLHGCASSQIPSSSLQTGLQTGSNPPVGEGEDCGRLTGRMQVRILQIRDYQASAKTSGLSRGLQGFATSLMGGTKQGMNPDSRYKRDVEQLQAQNAKLRALGCPTFDLDHELQAKGFSHTPTPR